MDVALWFHGEALSTRQHLLAAAFPPDFVEPLAWPSTDVQDRSRDAFLLKRAPVLCWAQPFSLFVFAIGVLVEASVCVERAAALLTSVCLEIPKGGYYYL